MALSPPTAPTAPDLNSPSTYNARVLDGFTYCFTTLPDWIAGLDSDDWFPVQSSAIDTTAGRVLTVGAFGQGRTTSPSTWPNASLSDCTGVGAGIYNLYSSVSDRPNDEYGIVYYSPRNSTTGHFIQTFYSVSSNKIYHRSSGSGTAAAPVWSWRVVHLSEDLTASFPFINSLGSMGINNAFVQGKRLTIADDSVGYVVPEYKGGWVFVSLDNDSDYPESNSAMFGWFDVGNSPMIREGSVGISSETGIGVPTGTTAVDGNVMLTAASDGKLYLVNRTGVSRTFTVHILR